MSPTIRNQAKLISLALPAALAGALFAAGTAVAQNPHFIRANITLDNRGNLVCSWKEAGLGDNLEVTYTCGADAVGAFFQCVNRGGGEPRPHTVEETDVNEQGTFPTGKNGQVTASLTVEVPRPPSDFCPNSRNWTLRLEGVRWCGTFLEDTTNNIIGAEVDELGRGNLSQIPSCEELLTSD